MLSDLIRARLSELGRAAVREARAAARVSRPARSVQRPLGFARDATAAWRERGEEVENAGGKHWRVRYELDSFCPQAGAMLAQREAAIAARGRPTPLDDRLLPLVEHFPSQALFLDLETCGFAGSAVFLVGVAWQVDDRLIVEQFFARDYAEEPAVLHSLWQAVDARRLLVTFNGKTFDWPMVRDRTARHRMVQARRSAAGGIAPLHCDLLHAARRRWKPYLPDCRLQTLERYVCNRHRPNDLAGALVPAAYHDFVRSGEASQIGAILEHNALDLATLVELSVRLLGE